MVEASCKVYVSVVTPWTMRSIGVMVGSVRLWCLNSIMSETWDTLVALSTIVWHQYCWSATPIFQLAVPQNSHEFVFPVFLWAVALQPRVPSGVAS